MIVMAVGVVFSRPHRFRCFSNRTEIRESVYVHYDPLGLVGLHQTHPDHVVIIDRTLVLMMSQLKQRRLFNCIHFGT